MYNNGGRVVQVNMVSTEGSLGSWSHVSSEGGGPLRKKSLSKK